MHNRDITNKAIILVADDSEADRELINRSLVEGKIECEIYEVEDGQMALDYLFGEGKYADRSLYPVPNILLLDINMPRKDGMEVLKTLREMTKYKSLPIIMLTTSNAEKDVIASYQLGVNAFMTKPVDPFQFIESICLLEKFWFRLVTLPKINDD